MKIVISGYGRMGHEVEQIALSRKHTIVTTIDNPGDWKEKDRIISTADVIIDFSLPETAVDIFKHCFELKIPVVTGTTGWYNQLGIVKMECEKMDASFFYSHNFSIGVNIFFEANKLIAKLTAATKSYNVKIEETHHIHKLDAPSGTAIKIADDIIEVYNNLSVWKNDEHVSDSELSIVSYRKGEVVGRHIVDYESDIDEINISHNAKNRKGFALGAVLAAEFIIGKKGFFAMSDLMNELQK